MATDKERRKGISIVPDNFKSDTEARKLEEEDKLYRHKIAEDKL